MVFTLILLTSAFVLKRVVEQVLEGEGNVGALFLLFCCCLLFNCM